MHDGVFKINGAVMGRMLIERSLAGPCGDARQGGCGQIERAQNVVSRFRGEDLFARSEEFVKAFPTRP